MAQNRTTPTQAQQSGPTVAQPSPMSRRHSLDTVHGCPLDRLARRISQSQYLLAAAQVLDRAGCLADDLASVPVRSEQQAACGLERIVSGRDVHPCKKRGECVGPTKRGKGTKLMVLADGQGFPLGVSVHSASPAEVTLAAETLSTVRVGNGQPGRPRQKPQRIIADKAYDSDSFRDWLADRGIELVCPHRRRRKKPPTQDGRKLRRYQRRWKIERSISWLGNFRRVLTRWDRNAEIYRTFVHIACAIIVCRYL